MLSAEKAKNRWPDRTALQGWACDSGGFTHVARHGGWTRSAAEHADLVRWFADRSPGMDWAAPQDWMCEPFVLSKTGLTLAEHQHRTVDNLLLLREAAPEINWIPVLQGYEVRDYYSCWKMYEAAGVDLNAEPLVGVGSVCRRQNSNEIELLFYNLFMDGLRCHGFGVKLRGLDDYKQYLQSADSHAWSVAAQYARRPVCGSTTHKTCSSCDVFAHAWYEDIRARCNLPVL